MPRRVLMTTDAVGGVWDVTLSLAQGLSRTGTRVDLAVFGPAPTADQCRAARAISGLAFHHAPFAPEWVPGGTCDRGAMGAWLRRRIRIGRPDLLHANGYAAAAEAPDGIPVVLTAHGDVVTWWRAVHRCDPPVGWSDYRRTVAEAVDRATVVATPTAAHGQALSRAGLVPAETANGRLRIISNGREPRAWTRRRKAPLILASGRLWDAAKNLSALDWAAASLPWPVVAAGALTGPSGCGAAAQARHVRTLGRLAPTELSRWVGRAAIFAHPARYEPFGLSVLEAGLAGCALVLGDIPSLRELWDGAAVFVPPDDPGRLRAVLDALCRDASRRRTLAARARRRAQAFGPAPMIAGYRRAYEDALAGLAQLRRAA